MTNSNEFILSVDNIYNVVDEHMNVLDKIWPDSEPHGPGKMAIVEIIDGIKLKLCSQAEKNANRYDSPFERAAKKITGVSDKIKPSPDRPAPQEKTSMQSAYEAAKARIRGSQD